MASGGGRLHDIAATLTAFANTNGGVLLIGVSDNGQVVGVPDPAEVCRAVDNVAVHNCEPPVTVVQEVYASAGGAVVVAVRVPRGDQRPYRTNRGVYFIRTSSGRRPASRQELLRLFQAVEGFRLVIPRRRAP